MNLIHSPFRISLATTVGDGVHNFLVWNHIVGYAVCTIIAWLQFRGVRTSKGSLPLQQWSSASIAISIASATALLGPGTVINGLSFYRDEILHDGADTDMTDRDWDESQRLQSWSESDWPFTSGEMVFSALSFSFRNTLTAHAGSLPAE